MTISYDDVHPNKADVIMALAGSNGGSWSTSFSSNSAVKPYGGEAIPVSVENDTIMAANTALSSKDNLGRLYSLGNSSHGFPTTIIIHDWYAPFASDLKDLGELSINFELGSPFKPFNQLMDVLPAASSHALPEHCRKLMMDPDSPIIDFYPTDFEVNMNGKQFAWQGIAKLPFIDEDRLLAEVKKVEHTLTEEEARRNSTCLTCFLWHYHTHTLSPYIFSLNDRCKQLSARERVEVREQIDPLASGGMNGYISLCAGDPCPPIFSSRVEGMDDIMDNQVM